MQIIFKYVWMYLAAGFVIMGAYTIAMTVWLAVTLKSDKLVKKVSEYNLALKIRLYKKHSGLAEARALLDALIGNKRVLLKAIVSGVLMWPISMAENLAVYPELMDYVRELKEESSGC